MRLRLQFVPTFCQKESLSFYIHLSIFVWKQYNPGGGLIKALSKMAARKGGIKVHQCGPL